MICYYLDDLKVGQRFVSGAHELDEAQIKAFAAEFDPQRFHLDEEAAKDSFFGGLVASGWHTASITMKLLVEGGAPLAGGVIGAGGEIDLAAPDAAGRHPPCRKRDHRDARRRVRAPSAERSRCAAKP